MSFNAILFGGFFFPLTDMLGIATVTLTMGNSSAVNALSPIVILITETNLVVRQVVRGDPVSTHPRKTLTATGRLEKGGGLIQSSLTMSLCSQGEVDLVVQKMNLAQLLAVLTQTEILRGDLITRPLAEDLVMNLNQKDPMMRDPKVVQMTVIRHRLQTIFLKCSCKYISVIMNIQFLYLKTAV